MINKGSGTLKYYNKTINNEIIKKYKMKSFDLEKYKFITKKLKEGDAFFINNKVIHQIHAKNTITLSEISTNQLNDVIRLKDKYGRK